MSYEAVRKQITSTFQREFATKHPTVPIKFENHPFEQPKGAPWVFCNVILNYSKRASIGGTKHYYHYGIVNVGICVPENTGMKTLFELTDTAFTILADRDYSLGADGGLTTYGAEQRQRGLINGFYVMNVLVEWRLDKELKRP